MQIGQGPDPLGVGPALSGGTRRVEQFEKGRGMGTPAGKRIFWSNGETK